MTKGDDYSAQLTITRNGVVEDITGWEFTFTIKKNANDIDLAVRGIKTGLFFKFYGELFKSLDKPVDLIDLDGADAYFAKRILERGKIIYGV